MLFILFNFSSDHCSTSSIAICQYEHRTTHELNMPL